MESRTQSTTSKRFNTDALFDRYMDVVNRVIGEDRDGLYGRAVQAWHTTLGEAPIAVGVYASDADEPHRWYTIRLADGAFALVERSRSEDAKFSWKVDEDHLAHVVDNPRTYTEQPMKLDLDWLATHMGL